MNNRISDEAIQEAAGRVSSAVERAKDRTRSDRSRSTPKVLANAVRDTTEEYYLEQEARRLLGRDTETSNRPDQEIMDVMHQIRGAINPRIPGSK